MTYVDDMQAPYRGMRMCHLLADSTEELLVMADRLGLARRWLQKPGTPGEHFDIAASKRRLAVQYGAREITWKAAGALVARKRQALQEER